MQQEVFARPSTERIYRCIYCLRDMPGSRFDRDHVIPYQLGRFNFPRLRLAVCKECNGALGRGPENRFATESFEAWARFAVAHQTVSQPLRILPQRSADIRVGQGTEGDGMRVHIRVDPERGAVVKLVPQIAIRAVGETEAKYYSIEEFDSLPDDALTGRSLGAHASTEDDAELALQAIRRRIPGFKVRERGKSKISNPPGVIPLDMQATVDQELGRVYVKIAFNYLVHVTGAAFVLDHAFDQIRRFVRYGEGDWLTFTHVRSGPFLEEETATKRINAHLLAVRWLTADSIVAHVCLFNGAIFDILLCSGFRGVWREIASGHAFAWDSGQVAKLEAKGRSSTLPDLQVMR